MEKNTSSRSRQRKNRRAATFLATLLVLMLVVTNSAFTNIIQSAFSENPLDRIFSILEDNAGEPATAADYEQMANLAIAKEDYPAAMEHLLQSIALTEEGDTAVLGALYTKLGSLHALMNDYESATEALAQALANNPKDSQALILRAQIAIEQEAYTDAVSWLEEYLAIEEQDAAIWTVMAQLYEALGMYDKSKESYARAYALDAGTMDNVFNAARSDYMIGNYEEAVAGYGQYIEAVGDTDGTAHFLRAVARVQLADYENAAMDLEQAISLGYADQAMCYEQLTICFYAIERYEDAIAAGETALTLEGQVATDALYQRMGVSAMALERYEEATQYLTQSLALNDTLEGSRYYRGVSSLALERYEDAIADFTASIEQDFLPQFCYYNRGVCYVQLDDYMAAVEDMDMTLGFEDGDETLLEAARDILWQIAQYYMNLEGDGSGGTPGDIEATDISAEPIHTEPEPVEAAD